MVLFCIYRLVREIGHYCNEINVWRVIAMLMGGTIIVGGVLILILMLGIAIFGMHESFSCQNGSYWGGER